MDLNLITDKNLLTAKAELKEAQIKLKEAQDKVSSLSSPESMKRFINSLFTDPSNKK